MQSQIVSAARGYRGYRMQCGWHLLVCRSSLSACIARSSSLISAAPGRKISTAPPLSSAGGGALAAIWRTRRTIKSQLTAHLTPNRTLFRPAPLGLALQPLLEQAPCWQSVQTNARGCRYGCGWR
eukprot:COSAG01_NODE_10015_length_2274_cov_2.200920_2_plen_125_part_00